MQPDIGKLIFEHLEKHGKEVIDSPGFISKHQVTCEWFDVLLLAKNWCQTTNLSSKRCSDMLGSVRNQVLYGGHNIVEERGPIEELAEA